MRVLTKTIFVIVIISLVFPLKIFANSNLVSNNKIITLFHSIPFKTPVRFEINGGQANKDVIFLSKLSKHNLLFTKSGLLLLNKSNSAFMQILNRDIKCKVVGLEKQAGKVNYFIGNDPKKWIKNISIYSKVKYENVYPGIDLIFYGKEGLLEYDFIVKAGADPSKIKIAFNGASKIEPNIHDDLVLHLGNERLVMKMPSIYQEINGIKQKVEGRYALVSNQVGFQVAKYNITKPLIIDPALVFSTHLGGESLDAPQGIAVDGSGNVYVAGHTGSSNFPTKNPIQGEFSAAQIGEEDVFVTKLNPFGELIYSTFLGGKNTEFGGAIATDPDGNVYVTGNTNSTDFPTVNPLQASNAGGTGANSPIDGFITKLNLDGSIVYSTYFGGVGSDLPEDIAVDEITRAIYITGTTHAFEKNFPTTPGAFGNDAGVFTGECFITKIDSQGSSVVYSTLLVDNNKADAFGRLTACYSIAVDPSGNAYVTGETDNKSFPVIEGAFQTMIAPSGDNCFGNTCEEAFVTKLNADGSMLIYSTFLGGSNIDRGREIKLDASLNAYITGETLSDDFPTTDSVIQKNMGTGDAVASDFNFDAYITKLDPSGSMLVYSTYLGGGGKDWGNALALNAAGDAYVTGYTQSATFPIKEAIQDMHGGGVDDVFITRINGDATNILFSTFIGGGGIDEGIAIALDPTNKVYVTGTAGDPEHFIASSGPQEGFPTTPGAFQPFFRGGIEDVFVLKIDESLTAPPVSSSGSSMSSSSGGTQNAIGDYNNALDNFAKAIQDFIDLAEEKTNGKLELVHGHSNSSIADIEPITTDMKSALSFKFKRCVSEIEDGIKRLRNVLRTLRLALCNREAEKAGATYCLKRADFDQLFPPVNNAFRSIKSTSRTDSNNNHKPDICEKEK